MPLSKFRGPFLLIPDPRDTRHICKEFARDRPTLMATVPSLYQMLLEVDIVRFCKENMAPYKVPKAIQFVDRIPLTSVGKVDKKALRERQVG